MSSLQSQAWSFLLSSLTLMACSGAGDTDGTEGSESALEQPGSPTPPPKKGAHGGSSSGSSGCQGACGDPTSPVPVSTSLAFQWSGAEPYDDVRRVNCTVINVGIIPPEANNPEWVLSIDASCLAPELGVVSLDVRGFINKPYPQMLDENAWRHAPPSISPSEIVGAIAQGPQTRSLKGVTVRGTIERDQADKHQRFTYEVRF